MNAQPWNAWRKVALLGASTMVVVGLAPIAASAQTGSDTPAACPARETARTFGWALDPNLYFRMPGGDFEDGGASWDLDGRARVVDGSNQTLAPVSPDDSHALSLPSGSAATADPLCVEGTATFMRFFARSRGLAGIAVVVVTAKDDDGRTQTLLSLALPLTSAWSSPLLLFRLPVLGDDLTSVNVQIRSSGLGAIEVDDVYIDPLRQR